MNPYRHYLGDQSPIPVIAATAERLRSLLDQLGDTRANRSPAAGKWSAREILCHLADTEIAFAFRLRQALAEDHHVIQPFDQDRWAAPYGSLDAVIALDTFAAIRKWNLALLRSLPAEAFRRTLNHPERGEMTYQVLVETMAGHDLNHLQQIETLQSQAH